LSTDTAPDAAHAESADPPPPPRRVRLIVRARGELLAAALTLTAYLSAWIARGAAPFGTASTSFSDESNQYIPLHTLFAGFLHGSGGGDLFFNWRSLFGANFLVDFTTYLTNPFSLVALAVPAHDAAVAESFVAPLTLVCAAAAMAAYLRRLGDGPWWLRALLASGYGLCAWAVYNTYVPMWTWGLVSFPLLCIGVEWLLVGRALTGRRFTALALLFALAWYGNFYTGFMATIAAFVVLLLRLASEPRALREWFAPLWRGATAAALGIGLAMPLIYPTIKATHAAAPALDGAGFHPASPGLFVAQLFPGTLIVHDLPPMIGIGALGLLAALTLPFNTRISRRVRVAWSAGIVLLALSFQWTPTEVAWHGFAQPHGNSYREAFLLSGFLTIAAWQSLVARPGLRTLAAGGGIYWALLLVVATTVDGFPGWSVKAAIAFGIVAAAALVAPRLSDVRIAGARVAESRRWLPPAAAIAAVCALVAASGLTVDRLGSLRTALKGTGQTTDSAAVHAKADAVAAVDGWPAYRTDPGPAAYVANEPMLVGGEGPAYYSSYLPQQTADLFKRLGIPNTYWGRGTHDAANPVLDAIFSIGARVSAGNRSPEPAVTREDAPPLVTVHPAGSTADTSSGTGTGGSVFAAQEAVLGYPVYQVPALAPTSRAGTYSVSCAAGTTAYWAAPDFAGKVVALGHTISFAVDTSAYSRAITRMGTVPASGAFTARISPASGSATPAAPIGCLDSAKLADAVAQLKATAATSIAVGGHNLSAVVSAARAGDLAVIATPDQPGWQCSANGGAPAQPADYHGLLAVRLDPGRDDLACSFTPPGLGLGAVAGGVSAAALAAVLALPALIRRRPLLRSRP